MSRFTDEELNGLMQQGLRQIPAPDVSVDFDSRVRAALRRPEPRWNWLWTLVRPAVAPAAFSLAVTLAGLIVLGSPKVDGSPRAQPPAAGAIALGRHPDRLRALDQALERLDRETPSLRGFAGKPKTSVIL